MGENREKKHLPLFGVGPIIVYGQVAVTVAGIVLVKKMELDSAEFSFMQIPFLIVGIALILFGFYLNYSAKRKSKLFQNVKENKLITDGVYAWVRNPVYSAALLACTGVIFIANNLLLLVVPVICWLYTTIFLVLTEEKWLRNLYGQEYVEYCRKVNRCIPWGFWK